VSKPNLEFSSGMKSLDDVLQGILPGDNVVLQVDDLDEYVPFVHKFVRNLNKEDIPLIYFRFAQHEFLIPSDVHATIIELRPEKGFEKFLSQIIKTIENFGIGACYVFDCLSDLIADWYSDVMLGNFFMLTCPYLYKFDTVAYFALYRHKHDRKVIKDIQDTAQVVLDIYRNEDFLYVHPLKVFERYSPTLYMLFKWELNDGVDEFVTVKNSARIASTLSSMQHWINIGKKRHDVWNLTFDSAKETVEGILLGEISPIRGENLKNHLIKMAVVRDDLLFILAIKYFDLTDILDIGQRMIGSGMIGGKSVGVENPLVCYSHKQFYGNRILIGINALKFKILSILGQKCIIHIWLRITAGGCVVKSPILLLSWRVLKELEKKYYRGLSQII